MALVPSLLVVMVWGGRVLGSVGFGVSLRGWIGGWWLTVEFVVVGPVGAAGMVG